MYLHTFGLAVLDCGFWTLVCMLGKQDIMLLTIALTNTSNTSTQLLVGNHHHVHVVCGQCYDCACSVVTLVSLLYQLCKQRSHHGILNIHP